MPREIYSELLKDKSLMSQIILRNHMRKNDILQHSSKTWMSLTNCNTSAYHNGFEYQNPFVDINGIYPCEKDFYDDYRILFDDLDYFTISEEYLFPTLSIAIKYTTTIQKESFNRLIQIYNTKVMIPNTDVTNHYYKPLELYNDPFIDFNHLSGFVSRMKNRGISVIPHRNLYVTVNYQSHMVYPSIMDNGKLCIDDDYNTTYTAAEAIKKLT